MTITLQETAHSAMTLPREEDEVFRRDHGLPNPSVDYFKRNGITTSDLLSKSTVNVYVTSILKQLTSSPSVDDQLLVDTFACSLYSDNPSFTAYNALVLLEYFTRTRYSHHLSVQDYASAVAGLSMHNGPTGSRGMHRLTDPDEIAGAATVIMFIGSMDRETYSKMSKMDYVGAANRSRKELALRNRYLDHLLRLNPEHFDSVCDYLREHPNSLTSTRKSLQPVIDSIHAEGMSVRMY